MQRGGFSCLLVCPVPAVAAHPSVHFKYSSPSIFHEASGESQWDSIKGDQRPFLSLLAASLVDFAKWWPFFFFVRLFFLSFIQLCCLSFKFTNVHRWAEKKMVLCLRAAGYKKVFYKLLGALLCFLFFNASSIISIFVSPSPSVVARNGAVLWFWCRSTPQVPFNQPYDCWISSFTHERKRAPFFSSLKDFSVRPPAPPLTPPLVLLNVNPVFLGG